MATFQVYTSIEKFSKVKPVLYDGDIGGVIIHNSQISKEIDSIQTIAKSMAR